MPRRFLGMLAGAALLVAPVTSHAQPVAEDAAVRAVVERFFAAQEAEDAAAYLALWSPSAQKPTADQLKFVFASGDDRFHDLAITRITPVGDLVRVLVTVRRERTDVRPDGTSRVSNQQRQWSLTFAREAGVLKLLSEGVPADDLADALIAAPAEADRQRLLEAESDLINERLIQSLSQRAANLAQQSRFAPAEKAYGIVLDVARRSGSRKAEGEALQNLGNARYYQGNLRGALAAYEARVVLERDLANEAGVAGALLGMATIRYTHFEYGVALGHYLEALAIFERLGDEMSVATTLVSTGNVFYLQGDYDGAIRDYRRGRDLYRKLVFPAGEARALEGLGRTLMAQGDYAGALEAFAGVAEEGRARSDAAMRGNASQSIGDVHFRLGNFDAARAAFTESRGHFEGLQDLRAAGRVWQALGLTELAAARFAAAQQAYNQSMKACTTAQDDECVARAVVGLAFAHHSQEQYDEAVAWYRKAIAAFVALKAGTEAARAEIGLSQSLHGRKDFAGAIAAAAHARSQSSLPDVLWRAHLSEARAHRRLKAAVSAMASARASVSIVRSMADSARRLPSQRVPADSIDAYAFLAVLYAEASDSSSAFTALEQRQAHALRLALANNERDIARGMTSAEREEERAVTAAVVSLQVQIDRERELPAPDKARIEQLEGRLSAAIAARFAAQDRLFQRVPDLRIWRGMSPAATDDELAALLPSPEHTVVSLVIDNEDLLAVVASRRDGQLLVEAQTTQVDRRDLAELIAAAVRPDTLRDVAAWRAAAGALTRTIPPKAVAAIAGARHAIVVPDDVLWRVPFEALPAQDGYLGDHTVVVYAGSIGALLRPPQMQTGADDVVGPRLVAIGAPELTKQTVDRLHETAPGWSLRSTESSGRDVREAVAGFETTASVLLTGPAATEQALRLAAPAAAALHIAAPFRLNSASPLFSPLLTSPASDEGTDSVADAMDDGVLELREVMNLTLTARVAVISDGGALSMRDAAAATGTLQWAWRAAGVTSMIVPRWDAGSAANGAMLARFHQRVAAGETPERALHALRTAARAAEATRAPWFWAQWMSVGLYLRGLP